MTNVVWGMDLLESEENTSPIDIREMSLQKTKDRLEHFDRILSASEEETDLDIFYQRGGRTNPRAEKAKEAYSWKTVIHLEGSEYRKLLNHFANIAEEGLDTRAVDLRKRHALYEQFLSDPEFIEQRKAALGAYNKRRITVESLGEISLDKVGTLLQTHPDTKVRESLFMKARELDDLERKVHEEIDTLNNAVRRHARAHNFFEVRAAYCEVDPAKVEQMMRKFVDGTKQTYEKLVRELIGQEKIAPWDLNYVIAQKDPFTRLGVSMNPSVLMAAGLELLNNIGYDPIIVKGLFQPGEVVHIDIEKREGKGPGAFTCSVGPYSLSKNILFYQPTMFEGDASRRLTVFPHELGHAIHHEMNRLASRRHGAIFFTENTVGLEIVSKFHDALPLEEAYLTAHYTGTDAKTLTKWSTFNTLHAMYGLIRIALGDIGMHRRGTEHAQEAFHEGSELVKPENVEPRMGPSPAYVLAHHVFNQPAYLFTYFLADLYRIALLETVRQAHGSLITPKTGPFLIEKVMTGNITPMHERVVKATGTTDIVENAIRYFNEKK